MSIWTKRTSKKTGRYTRSTTTTRGDGSQVRSTSSRVGNLPRVTLSMGHEGGGLRTTTTEYSSLGRRTTSKTIGRTGKMRYRKGKPASLKVVMWMLLAIAAFYVYGYFFA
jgi:hypothetical protein